MLDRLKIGTHITLFPEWLIEWEYRAMDFDVGAEWIFSVNSESGEIEALEAVEGSIELTECEYKNIIQTLRIHFFLPNKQLRILKDCNSLLFLAKI